MKNIFLPCIILFTLQSCWAPRCPLVGCQVGRKEHRHSELGGTYGGKNPIPERFHFFWDKEQSKGKPLSAGEKGTIGPDGKKRKRFKRLMPWEKGF